MKHYFEYIKLDGFFSLQHNSMKSYFVSNAMSLIRKLAPHKKKISILEIGSTLGENYQILNKMVKEEKLNCTLSFVGVEIEGSLVEFSRELYRDNPDVFFIHGEGADLSRFPNETFDICITHGVSNHVKNGPVGFSDLLRVSRVAALAHIYTNRGDAALNLTHGGAGYKMWIPTLDEVKTLAGAVAPMFFYHF